MNNAPKARKKPRQNGKTVRDKKQNASYTKENQKNDAFRGILTSAVVWIPLNGLFLRVNETICDITDNNNLY